MYSRFVQWWVLVVFGVTMFLANVLLVGLMANIAHRAKGWRAYSGRIGDGYGAG